MRAFAGEGQFHDFLAADTDIRAQLSEAEIDAAFDLKHALAHADAIVTRALAE